MELKDAYAFIQRELKQRTPIRHEIEYSRLCVCACVCVCVQKKAKNYLGEEKVVIAHFSVPKLPDDKTVIDRNQPFMDAVQCRNQNCIGGRVRRCAG